VTIVVVTIVSEVKQFFFIIYFTVGIVGLHNTYFLIYRHFDRSQKQAMRRDGKACQHAIL